MSAWITGEQCQWQLDPAMASYPPAYGFDFVRIGCLKVRYDILLCPLLLNLFGITLDLLLFTC